MINVENLQITSATLLGGEITMYHVAQFIGRFFGNDAELACELGRHKAADCELLWLCLFEHVNFYNWCDGRFIAPIWPCIAIHMRRWPRFTTESITPGVTSNASVLLRFALI